MIKRSATLAVASLFLLPGAAHAAFPGANGKIAYVDGNGSDIVAVNPDGSGATTLAPSKFFGEPAYSPDGRKIAFTADNDGDFEIYVMNADGTGQVQLTHNSTVDARPDWSPDGQKIAFASDRDAPGVNFDVYSMNANGTGVTRLTTDPASDGGPTWSPDGIAIAFVSNRDGLDEIYRMNSDGTGVQRLTTNSVQDAEPDFSPDGKKIALSRFDGSSAYEIHVMNADGTGQSQITSNGSLASAPAWSPDGTKIAYVSQQGVGQEVYRMNADGTSQVAITTSGSAKSHPNWQPRYEIPASSPPLSVGLVPSYRQTISPSQCAARGGTATSHAAPLSLSSCNPPGYLPGTQARFGIQAVGSAGLAVVPGNPATVADEADHAIAIDLTDVRSGNATGPDYSPVAVGPDVTTFVRFRLSDTLNGPNEADPGTVTDSELAIPVDCATTADPAIGSHCAATTSADGITAGLVREGRNAVTSLFRVRLRDAGSNGVRGDSDDREFATQGLYTP